MKDFHGSGEQYVTIREVARHFGIGTSTVSRHVKNGVFPRPHKVGIAARWKISEIEEWLRSKPAANSAK